MCIELEEYGTRKSEMKKKKFQRLKCCLSNFRLITSAQQLQHDLNLTISANEESHLLMVMKRIRANSEFVQMMEKAER